MLWRMWRILQWTERPLGKETCLPAQVNFTGQNGDRDREGCPSPSDEQLRKLFVKFMEKYEQGKCDSDLSGSSSTVKWYKCRGYGNMARECHKDVWCFSCWETGHVHYECLKQVGQAGSQGRKSELEPNVHSVHVDNPKAAATVIINHLCDSSTGCLIKHCWWRCRCGLAGGRWWRWWTQRHRWPS